MNKTIKDKLKQFAIAIKKTIDEGISQGSLGPELTAYRRWKVTNFQYSDEGITRFGAQGEDYTKETWGWASAEIGKSLEKMTEFVSVLHDLSATFTKRDTLENDLISFGRNVTRRFLFNKNIDEVDALIVIFLKNLQGEPVEYGAIVELTGLILQPENISISNDVVIRQTKPSDFEKEFSEYGFNFVVLPHPTAILKIEFLGVQGSEIQKRVEQALAILRLFRVGSVKYSSYTMFSESVTDVFTSGQLRSGDNLAPLDTYLIKVEDDSNLKNFWLRVSDVIPKSFYDASIAKIDHSTIAYNRYTDALLHNGILERRIANSIMGLEALFFKADGEAQELSYRLRLRVGKVLGLLEFNPHEVSERLKDAYGIRSTFTHGGHLDHKMKRKLELKYGDPKKLLLSILDYLRISIIINLFMTKEKDEFIDLIDDSLIDSKKDSQLKMVFSASRDISGSRTS